ncbi:MAG: CoA-binding protein [Spirochaetes bacterium]|nr:CoA-binding protein [Spirochaetota bacterium]HOD15889.1 CoA-binding protein [Spirochaetota bacterium]HPG50974.1 CoA-binding protein [Spirochaetota bacterium]
MLDYFFHPNGVAIIGATDSQLKGGFHLVRNALAGYKGTLYPVNPKYTEILGVPCYPGIESIPGNFDMAVYFIPAKFLPETIMACSQKGVKGIIIQSAGFSEVGPEGKKLQEDSVALARKLGIRLWGPNCMGYLDGHSRNVFSFMYSDKWTTLMQPGNVSLIVQSGMLSAGFLLMMLDRGGIGMSKVCSIGNKCDVHETELLEYLINDVNTGVIGCYLESIIDGRKFLDLARSTDKPVIVLKSGRSDSGAKAAMSHTASLSGEAAVYTGAFRQAGITQVYDMHELMDMVRGFSKTGTYRPRGKTAVVTFSGGAGIVTADLLEDRGLGLADLSADTMAAIKEVFPPWMEPSHPVDLWPAVEQNGASRVYNAAVEAVLKDPGVDSLIIETFAWSFGKSDFFGPLGALKKKYNKPVAVWQVGSNPQFDEFRIAAENAGLPVFEEIGRCAAFLDAVKQYYGRREKLKAGT